jgi:hypothetical protein
VDDAAAGVQSDGAGRGGPEAWARAKRGLLPWCGGGMSFRLSSHLPLLGPTGAHWLDDRPDLSCKDSTQRYAMDDPLLSCKQQVGGSSPPASSHQRSRMTRAASAPGPSGQPPASASAKMSRTSSTAREKAAALRAKYGL